MMFAENIHTHQPSPAAARTMTEIKKNLCLKITRPLFHSKYFKKTRGYQFFVLFLLSNKLSSLDIKACSIKIDFQQIQNLSNFLHYRKNQVLNFIYLSFSFFCSPVFIPASPSFSFFLVFIKKSFKRMVIFHGGIV